MKLLLHSFLLLLAAVCACRQVAPLHTPHADDRNVICLCKYNVDPTGETDETESIQMAIDDVCRDPEKDTLIISCGIYRTGPLHLREGVTLYLEEGAVLQSLRQRPTGR